MDIEKRAYELFPVHEEIVQHGWPMDHTGKSMDDFYEDVNEFPRRVYIRAYKEARQDMGATWKSIEHKPTKPGIYVVARFEDGKMVDYDINWAYLDGYFGPNNVGWQERIEPTHWMSRDEYRTALGNLPIE